MRGSEAIATAALFLMAAGCGGAASRARTALDAGDSERALQEASRASERGQSDSRLLLVDALLLSGDVEGARVRLAEVADATESQRRVREFAIAEADGDWRGFASVWADGFSAGAPLPLPEDPEFLGQVVSRLLDQSQAAAMALLRELSPERLADPDVSLALDRALDLALYQMHYRGEFHVVRGTTQALMLLLGDRFILAKHMLASDLSRYRTLSPGDAADLRGDAIALAGDDLEYLSLLAMEFSTRGAYSAGSSAFEIAAGLDPSRERQWLRGSANAAYLAGDRSIARGLLERAGSGEARSAALSAAFDVALRHGDGEFEFEFVRVASEMPCEAGDRVAVGETLRARALIANGRGVEAAQRIGARLDACSLAGLATSVAIALIDAGEVTLAEPLLYRAVLDRAHEAELVSMFLSLAIEAGQPDHALEVAREAAGTVATRSASIPETLAMHRALRAVNSPEVTTVAHNLIDAAVAREPGAFELVSELADSHLRRDDEDAAAIALDRYIGRSTDSLIAMLGVARWMEERFDDGRLIAEAYVRVAEHPESSRTFDTLGGRSAAEHAWYRAATNFSSGRGGSETADSLWEFMRAAGLGSYTAWDDIWSEDRFFRVLGPADVLALGEAAHGAGLEDARIQLRLGAAYVAHGAEADARDAYIAAIRADPSVIGELMAWLGALDDNEILIEVLHALPPSDRPYQAWVSLANAHATEAGRGSLSHRRRTEHRVDARQAFWSASSLNPAASFRAQRFSDGGLPDVAAHLHLRDLEENPESRTALQLSLLALAESGASDGTLAPLLERALAEFEEAPLSRLRSTLAEAGYLAEALRVGRRQLARSGLSTEGLEATAAAVIGYAAELRDLDAVRALTDESFVRPALLLADPAGVPPERYANVADREGRAAALMGTASRLYESAELWSLAESAALRRLELTDSTSRTVLERCILSAIRARGGALPRGAMNAIANASGGSPQDWRMVASILAELERPELEMIAWTRVLDLVPDDWSAELELGELEALSGRLEGAGARFERAVEGATSDGRGPQTAVHAARVFAEVGRADLAIALLDRLSSFDLVAIELADFELGAGLTARALRRLRSASLPPAETARVYLRHGFSGEGVTLWETRASGFTPSIAAELVRARTDAVFEELPFARALSLVATMIERSVGDVRTARLDSLVRAGRPLEAAAELEKQLRGAGSEGELRDLVALYAAGGAWEAANRVASGSSSSRVVLRDAFALEVLSGREAGVIERRPSYLEALAAGSYDDAIRMLSAVLDERTTAPLNTGLSLSTADAALALARSGFANEAYALVIPRLDGAFDADLWLLAMSMGAQVGDLAAVAHAAIARHRQEPSLALGSVQVLGGAGELDMASDLLAALPLRGERTEWSAHSLATAGMFGHEPSLARLEASLGSVDTARSIWNASRDRGLTSIAVAAADQLPLSDQALIARFTSGVSDGQGADAYAVLAAELPQARHPISVLRRAILATSHTFDPELRSCLVRDALEFRPNDIELLIELATTPIEEEREDAVGRLRAALACNAGGTSHAVHALVRAGADEAALETADGCEDLPLRARVVLGLAQGELPDGLEELKAPMAIAYATLANERGDYESSEWLASAAIVGVNPSPRAFAQRAIARAGRADIAGASSDAERFLASAYDLVTDGGGVLAALASCGAYEAADLVAHALRRIPPYSGAPTGGAAVVIQAFAASSPTEGLRYVEQHMPGASVHPVVTGLTFAMASLEEAAGSADNAISLYERHLELFPSDAQAMNNLAYLLTEHTDRHAEAVQLSLNSIALREFAPANVLDTLAWALFHEGSMERARGLAELALRTLPQESAATPDPETERVMLLHLQTIEMAIEGAAALESPANPQTQRRRRRRTQ